MRKVDPVEARKGTFLESFDHASGDLSDKAPDAVIAYCKAAEASMKQLNKLEHLHVRGEIVYTQIPSWGKRKGHQWQVFLLP
jgi:hypothetical protein